MFLRRCVLLRGVGWRRRADLGARRTKDLIKDQLPTKTDNIVLCPLTTLQMTVYKRFLSCSDVQTMLTINEPCTCGAKDDEGLPWAKGKCCARGWTKVRRTSFGEEGTALIQMRR